MSICLEAGAGVITLQTGQHTKQDRLGAFNVLVHPKQTITTLALMLLLVFNLEDIRPFSEVKLDGKSDFRSILTLLASFSWVLGTMSIETDRSNLLDGGYLQMTSSFRIYIFHMSLSSLFRCFLVCICFSCLPLTMRKNLALIAADHRTFSYLTHVDCAGLKHLNGPKPFCTVYHNPMKSFLNACGTVDLSSLDLSAEATGES